MENEKQSRGLMLFPACEWDKDTRYSVKGGEFMPMVRYKEYYFILFNKDTVAQGVAPDSKNGTKYWRMLPPPTLIPFDE